MTSSNGGGGSEEPRWDTIQLEEDYPELAEWLETHDPDFWEDRLARRRRELKLKGILYRARELSDRVRESFRYATALGRDVLIVLILPIVLLVLTQGLPHTLFSTGVLPLVFPSWVPPILSEALNLLASLASTPHLAVIAQVSGVFVGLYFTAVVVAFSTRYAESPASVRRLFARSPRQRTYLRIAGSVTVFSFSLLVLDVAGVRVSALSTFTVLFLGSYVVLGAVELLPHTFLLYDPRTLTGPLHRTLRRSVEQATPEGPNWKTPKFQETARKRVQHALSIYDDLITDLGESDRSNTEELLGVGMELQKIRLSYAEEKPSIPPESQWFERVSEHPDLSQQAGSVQDPYAESRRPIPPDEVPHGNWFEERLDDLTEKVLHLLVGASEFDGAEDVLRAWGFSLTRMASPHQPLDAMESFERLSQNLIVAFAGNQDQTGGDGSSPPEKIKRRIRLIEILARVPYQIFDSFHNETEQVPSQHLKETCRAVIDGEESAVRKASLPAPVNKKAVDLLEGLQWEIALHGERITPERALLTELREEWGSTVEDWTERLAHRVGDNYPAMVEELEGRGNHLLAAHAALIGQYILNVLAVRTGEKETQPHWAKRLPIAEEDPEEEE